MCVVSKAMMSFRQLSKKLQHSVIWHIRGLSTGNCKHPVIWEIRSPSECGEMLLDGLTPPPTAVYCHPAVYKKAMLKLYLWSYSPSDHESSLRLTGGPIWHLTSMNKPMKAVSTNTLSSSTSIDYHLRIHHMYTACTKRQTTYTTYLFDAFAKFDTNTLL